MENRKWLTENSQMNVQSEMETGYFHFQIAQFSIFSFYFKHLFQFLPGSINQRATGQHHAVIHPMCIDFRLV